jgi:hypothetical protein
MCVGFREHFRARDFWRGAAKRRTRTMLEFGPALSEGWIAPTHPCGSRPGYLSSSPLAPATESDSFNVLLTDSQIGDRLCSHLPGKSCCDPRNCRNVSALCRTHSGAMHMGTADQYRARADFCQRMAEKAIGEKARTTWLNLAANALALAEKPTETPSKSFHSRERERSAGQEGSFSGHS